MSLHQRLKTCLNYDPETGAFIWLMNRSRTKAGSIAGCPDGLYWRIKFERRRHLAHRLAWFYVHGSWPVGEIDHIDGEKTNNRIANLRDVTVAVNRQNLRSARGDNSSGLLGVSSPKVGRYKARIRIGGREISLGRFDTPQEAHESYLVAKREIHSGCTI